jgi:hypothetical protein
MEILQRWRTKRRLKAAFARMQRPAQVRPFSDCLLDMIEERHRVAVLRDRKESKN